MNRAILVFLKLPVPGRVKTRLAKSIGDEAAAAAYEKLVTRVFECCGEASADRIVIAFDPAEKVDEVKAWLAPRLELLDSEVSWIPQAQGDLGERLHAASKVLFLEEPRTLLSIIGTDCIHLDPDLFEEAWASLAAGIDVVFGPTEDGGYYLIGLKEPQDSLFSDIPWSTENTLKASLQAAQSEGLKSFQLSPRIDVDTIDEWEQVRDELG
ncbi:MAG: TIGR04282 family arsenosugar biosynthesis glycosyltransferase [Verrucomicrobiales bacterium]|nr:TIGR04282 family arsenosugar biosynthesis glycosyltransferase [Verrucomicrobiales bacterium]